MSVRLVLDVEPEAQPVCGWLEQPGSHRVPFIGVLKLLAALERALGEAAVSRGSNRS
jgi:hypothetical protein